MIDCSITYRNVLGWIHLSISIVCKMNVHVVVVNKQSESVRVSIYVLVAGNGREEEGAIRKEIKIEKDV